MTSRPDAAKTGNDRWRLASLLLVVTYLMLGFIYSVIQPPTAPPDETANMQYVQFLIKERRLPVWKEIGGGEGGYEAQHPPLSYLLEAIPYTASASSSESYRWLTTRLTVLVFGLALFVILPPLGRRLFPDDPLAAFTLTATVVLMPHSLMYLTFANPDGFCLLIAAASLVTAVRIYADQQEHPSLPWLAGALSAAASIVKLTVAPVLVLLLAAQWLRHGQNSAERWRKMAVIIGVWAVGGAWWYVRNLALYGTPFIHTKATMGAGVDYLSQNGVFRVGAVGALETYMSIWAQRGWFPAGTGEIILYSFITVFVVLAVVGFVLNRRPRQDDSQPRNPALRFAVIASTSILLFTLVSQQVAYWFVDAGWNAGGRYILTSLPEIAVLLVLGLQSLKPTILSRVALGGWIALLVTMNLISANTIISDLVPRDYPGWRMFEFPAQASSAAETSTP
ncbi:MAG: glycosyltransferase 87 family protein [Armatimonadota bacterium]